MTLLGLSCPSIIMLNHPVLFTFNIELHYSTSTMSWPFCARNFSDIAWDVKLHTDMLYSIFIFRYKEKHLIRFFVQTFAKRLKDFLLIFSKPHFYENNKKNRVMDGLLNCTGTMYYVLLYGCVILSVILCGFTEIAISHNDN